MRVTVLLEPSDTTSLPAVVALPSSTSSLVVSTFRIDAPDAFWTAKAVVELAPRKRKSEMLDVVWPP